VYLAVVADHLCQVGTAPPPQRNGQKGTEMAGSAPLRKALDALEARRVDIERQIIEDLDSKFFSTPEPEIRNIVSTRITAGLFVATFDQDSTTDTGSFHTITWYSS
jgi:hypothetical protein